MILLAIAGTLPEIAITVSAAASGHLGLAAGNLIGGIAIQTMVLVLCDAATSRTQSLTYLVGSLLPVLEGLIVVAVVAEVTMGALLPEHVSIGPVSPASIGIALTWLAGVALLNYVRHGSPWECVMPRSKPGRPHRRVPHPGEKPDRLASSPALAILVFVAASLVTLGAGVLLEVSGNMLADRWNVKGVIFGATVLALATALPEISSGIAAVRLGDNQLAVADIFGGNSFQVSLFLLADLIAGKPVLPYSGDLNAWLAGLGIVLTVIYCTGVIVRREGCVLRLGLDSMIVIGVFALGIAGLIAVSNG